MENVKIQEMLRIDGREVRVVIMHPEDYKHLAFKGGLGDAFDPETLRTTIEAGVLGKVLGCNIVISKNAIQGQVVLDRGITVTTDHFMMQIREQWLAMGQLAATEREIGILTQALYSAIGTGDDCAENVLHDRVATAIADATIIYDADHDGSDR